MTTFKEYISHSLLTQFLIIFHFQYTSDSWSYSCHIVMQLIITQYNNIIELLKGVFVHCIIQTTYLFNKMGSEFSISMDF